MKDKMKKGETILGRERVFHIKWSIKYFVQCKKYSIEQRLKCLLGKHLLFDLSEYHGFPIRSCCFCHKVWFMYNDREYADWKHPLLFRRLLLNGKYYSKHPDEALRIIGHF